MTRAKTPRLVLPLGAALLVAACGGGGPKVSLQPATTTPATAATTTAAATAAAPTPYTGPVAPLTGTAATAAAAGRPAVVVPLPVEGATGLDRADLVYQEYETRTVLRAVAVFQSQEVGGIGPVGQVRPMDPSLLPVLRPVYANTGGASGTETLLARAKVTQVTTAADPDAFGPGPAVSTAAVRAAATGGTAPPGMLSYAAGTDTFATTPTRKATSLTITAPGSAPETWTYSASAKTWSRAGSPGVAVRNLVVQSVSYKDVLLRKPDRPARSARVLGRGSCVGYSAGTYTSCSWFKPAPTSLTAYVDSKGVPLRFATGRTWVVLLPPGGIQVAR